MCVYVLCVLYVQYVVYMECMMVGDRATHELSWIFWKCVWVGFDKSRPLLLLHNTQVGKFVRT